MRQNALTLTLAGLLGLAAILPPGAALADPFDAATTPDQLLDAGAQKLSGDEIRTAVSGRRYDGGDWIWTVSPNGYHQATAKDRSRVGKPGMWEVQGDRLCLEGPDYGRSCLGVYALEGRLRLADGPDHLWDWNMTPL